MNKMSFNARGLVTQTAKDSMTEAQQQYLAEKRRDKARVDECEERAAVAEAAILTAQVIPAVPPCSASSTHCPLCLQRRRL